MMRPGEQQFVDMMKLRGWAYQQRPDKLVHDTWTFSSTKPAYAGQPPQMESINIDTALHFRKNGSSLIVNLARERVINYNGWPSSETIAMPAACMSLNDFYGEIDNLCGFLQTPVPARPLDPKKVWECVRATVG